MPPGQTDNLETIRPWDELQKPNLSVFRPYSGDGTLHAALARLREMTSDEWENTTLAYADALRNKEKYSHVFKLGGVGDKGRDVVALYAGETHLKMNKWDCYQCKHYKDPLSLSGVRSELEKFLFSVFTNEYPLPKKYFLVAPCGLGPSLKDCILQDKPDIKNDLLVHGQLLYNQGFPEFIRSFDFSIFDFVEPSEMIDDLRQSRWGSAIFDIPLERLPIFQDENPPLEQEQSARYVNALREAYSDYKNDPRLRLDDLSRTDSQLWKHFEQSRKAFHSTEAMFRFYRSSVPPDSDKILLHEVENGINGVFFDPDISDGYRRVLEAVREAKTISLNRSVYKDQIGSLEKEGACHHLSNRSDKPIKWVN